MGFGNRIIAFLFTAMVISGCISAPAAIDKEKAGYIAGIKFLETHPGEQATYIVTDTGGDAYSVYFNITGPTGEDKGFAEYHVDKRSRDVYVSSVFATSLAIKQSVGLTRVFERYSEAKIDGNLISDKKGSYVWNIHVIANGVDIADFKFDAVEEKIIGEPNIKSYFTLNINTGENF